MNLNGLTRTFTGCITLCFFALILGPNRLAAAAANDCTIVFPKKASWCEVVAAQEVRRYLYLTTGKLLELRAVSTLPKSGDLVVVARKDQPLALSTSPVVDGNASTPTAQGYSLKTGEENGRRILLLLGGDDAGTLYAAYRLAEIFGVRFYLHGDVVPEAKVPLKLPLLNENSKPLFALRGIQPFHDFPEGPDWWNQDDYLAVLAQLPKLRMNFIGLHTYPEDHPNAEPTVWIGLPQDTDKRGRVKFSYPSSYANAWRGKSTKNWGYAFQNTGDFVCGSSELFERDDFGPEPMTGFSPEPNTPEGNNEVFERTSAMLRNAFGFAHQLGIKTCVGTETPLTVPKALKDHLASLGKSATNAATVEEIYEGIFQRAAKSYPLDYYWFWTPEGWTWQGVNSTGVIATTNDLLRAITAYRKVTPPFQLATCGWVLGPQNDRALFGKILPNDIAVSCINRQVGKTPVDSGFAEMSGRSKWAIPWLEDDGALIAPELWAGRMRRDARDALAYGCDGLMGIHWRTRVLSPNVGALAQASWDQRAWNTPTTAPARHPRLAGANGGQYASFHAPVHGTKDDFLYQTVRWDVSSYHLPAANGPCNVKLQFCEPVYSAGHQRVFSVKLQGKPVVENLDIFARVGKMRALDCCFTNVSVTNGWLDVDFVPQTEFPCIAAISVEGDGFKKKINCGGQRYQDYEADSPPAQEEKQLYPPIADFYEDWAAHEFGSEAAHDAARIFTRIDGYLPRPAEWHNGPGNLVCDKRSWEEITKDYWFVDEFAALGSRVVERGARERFDYWLNNFRYMKSMARLGCTWGEFNKAVEGIKKQNDATQQKQLARETLLPLLEKMKHETEIVFGNLLATVGTPGELGTVANWNEHVLPEINSKIAAALQQVMGEAPTLPVQPERSYHGPTRIIVPTTRGSIQRGEHLKLKVLVLSRGTPQSLQLFWRKLGGSRFTAVPLRHIARGVYEAKLPAMRDDFEYYVNVESSTGEMASFPATAPELNQSVIVLPTAKL